VKQYLGDGVYVTNDGYSLILTAENGIEVTNTVYLDPQVYDALRRYVEYLRTGPSQATSKEPEGK
jgi:hypothetical protein